MTLLNNGREEMMILNQGKIPKEIESLSLKDQKMFFHNLREESEIKYNKIYSDYRREWKKLNTTYKQIYNEIEISQKEYVIFINFFFLLISSL
jgi:uncharacterized protein YecT (DUF1311 family)